MKNIIFLTLAVILTVILFSCKSDNVTNSTGINSPDTSGFVYPFAIGNSWSYTTKEYASDIHPDSILHYFSNYPITWTGTVTILYDTLINNIQTRCLLEVLTVTQNIRQSRTYMINNDTALLMYAQRSMATLIIPDVKSGKIKFNLDYGPGDDTLLIYDPPYAILKYPVVTGKTWSVYRTDTLTKKYEGYEQITVGAGSFRCMKIKTIFSTLPESPFYDYYCKYGLLKRTVTYNDMLITNQWFPEGIGTADLTFTTTANSFNVR